MSKFRTMVTAAASVGLSLMAAGVMAVPVHGTAEIAATGVGDRVALGFMNVEIVSEPDPALAAAAGRVAKGDFMERPGCFGQVWPDITPECLSKGAGTVTLPVRTVTLGYQVGEADTVLVRMPALDVAQR